MERTASGSIAGWSATGAYQERSSPLSDFLLRLVDAGLAGVICVLPFVFGGRHDVARLILVCLITLTATAWFARQTILPDRLRPAGWPRTVAHVILLLAATLLIVQIVPLPPEWLTKLAPATVELLPMWTAGGGEGVGLGAWQTLSLTPHETTKSLAMLLSYSLLFIVVAGRIRQTADVERLMNWIAMAAVLMATFGVVQYFTSDGRFFWFYSHPHRSATHAISGAFTNRNHFASFLVLGIGPLVAWLLRQATIEYSAAPAAGRSRPSRHHKSRGTAQQLAIWAIAAALAFVVFAVLSSRSRGGAVALLVAASVLTAIYCYRRLVGSRFVYGLVGLVVVVVGLLSLHGYDQVANRLGDFTELSVEQLDRDAGRRTIWAANLAAFQSHALVGAGAGSHSAICPVYLSETHTVEFTHAENGYLQVATETGLAGVFLLMAGVGLIATWCGTCLRRATKADDIRLLGAVAAGLAASLAHSTVDFVWYIPACMSITVVLAACALRMSQLVRSSDVQPPGRRPLTRHRWLELATAAALIGGWTVYVYAGPAVAAIHWDRYLLTSTDYSKYAQRQAMVLVAGKTAAEPIDHQAFNDKMIRHLERVVQWDPRFARARLRLAEKYLTRFEMLQQRADNAMGVGQIRDAALASSFAGRAELDDWLERAFGSNIDWLRRASEQARLAAWLCPLQGEAYVYLADLCFLGGQPVTLSDAYREQALRVRPVAGEVLFEIGRQELLDGNLDAALRHWQHCFATDGHHQRKIVFLLAGHIPAPMFLETFEPDWRTLREIWARYRESADPQDRQTLLAYAAERAELETRESQRLSPARIWFWLSTFYAESQRATDALACLQRGYASDAGNYQIRHALAMALQKAGRFAEAEPHIRWCLARQPADRRLATALVEVTRQRHARREHDITGAGSQPAINR